MGEVKSWTYKFTPNDDCVNNFPEGKKLRSGVPVEETHYSLSAFVNGIFGAATVSKHFGVQGILELDKGPQALVCYDPRSPEGEKKTITLGTLELVEPS